MDIEDFLNELQIDQIWLEYRLDYLAAMHAKDRDAAFSLADYNYRNKLKLMGTPYPKFIGEVRNEPL